MASKVGLELISIPKATTTNLLEDQFLLVEFLLELIGFVKRVLFLEFHRLHLLLDRVHSVNRHSHLRYAPINRHLQSKGNISQQKVRTTTTTDRYNTISA